MKKTTILLFLSSLFWSCTSPQKGNSEIPLNTRDGSQAATFPTLLPAEPAGKRVSPKRLTAAGDSILQALESGDFKSLRQWIHPQFGLHFSPYGNLNKKEGQTCSGPELVTLSQNGKAVQWGFYDGSGEPINLTLAGYLKKFVLDRDFRNAPAISVDSVMGRGNTLLNTKEMYPEASVVEYYFPGTEAQGFMDWKTLRLVFQEAAGRLWLMSIVHDEWTI